MTSIEMTATFRGVEGARTSMAYTVTFMFGPNGPSMKNCAAHAKLEQSLQLAIVCRGGPLRALYITSGLGKGPVGVKFPPRAGPGLLASPQVLRSSASARAIQIQAGGLLPGEPGPDPLRWTCPNICRFRSSGSGTSRSGDVSPSYH